MITLSKTQKKICRELIEKGLQKEFEQAILAIEKECSDWKNHNKDNRETYHTLYELIITKDKQIARRYDYMTGSKYLTIVIEQFSETLLDESDLDLFNEEVKEFISNAIKFNS